MSYKVQQYNENQVNNQYKTLYTYLQDLNNFNIQGKNKGFTMLNNTNISYKHFQALHS